MYSAAEASSDRTPCSHCTFYDLHYNLHYFITQHCINIGFVLKDTLVQLPKPAYCEETFPFMVYHVLFCTILPWTWPKKVSGSHQVRLELSSTHGGAHWPTKRHVFQILFADIFLLFPENTCVFTALWSEHGNRSWNRSAAKWLT